VTFDPVIAAALMRPVSVDPHSVAARRLDPVAGNPDVGAAVPAMITVDPHPAFVRAWTRMFDDGRRRAHLHVNVLCEGRGDRGDAEKCGCCNEEQFFHRSGISFLEKVVDRLRFEIDGFTAHPMEPEGFRRVADKIFSQTDAVMVCEG
jgi:hypothetical protein